MVWRIEIAQCMYCLVVSTLMYCYTEFAERPVNISESLPIGSETKDVVFRCRHQSPLIDIVWRVNGSSVGPFPDITPGFMRENGTLVYMLTIPIRSEYNGTEVVCVANFLDGSPSEVTPLVTLTIIAGN